ncbi:hypothetical protein HU200_002026 [Digitaria exilis]|uniref:Pentatricopeptide repeat-containing protein n=1 Tax=Digitaria exilis TaxID=1010633 RepID=A0A835FXK4_9POAL|nr:hypothetical protein HU200_002026 [Digitaria exilis]
MHASRSHLPATGDADALLRLVAACRAPGHLPVPARRSRAPPPPPPPLAPLRRSRPRQAHPGLRGLLRAPPRRAPCSSLPAPLIAAPPPPQSASMSSSRALTAASLHRDALRLFASMRPRGPDCFPRPLHLPAGAQVVRGVQGPPPRAPDPHGRRQAPPRREPLRGALRDQHVRAVRPPGGRVQGVRRNAAPGPRLLDAMISGFARAGLSERAVEVFKEFVALQCSIPDADMYASCGCLKDAREIFDSMSARDVMSWTSIISAYGKHGHGREAVDLFEKMLGQGLEPDSVAFVAVLAACSHAGLLDVGQQTICSD